MKLRIGWVRDFTDENHYFVDGRLRVKRQALIICDIDEVVLRYFCYIKRGLDGTAYRLELDGFDLRIRAASSGDLVSQELSDQLSDRIIEDVVESQSPVDGAVEHLNRLAMICDLVFLTNTREKLYRQRRDYLDRICLPFPLLLNQGGKGKSAAQLIERLNPSVTFVIDDSVRQLQSIANHVSSAHLIRAMVTPETRQTKPSDDYFEVRNWSAIEAHIVHILGRS